MTKLTWVPDVNKRYELGVDRAVFYPWTGAGVPWNGVISVVETKLGSDRNEHYLDGVKYYESISTSNYQATVKAYSSPLEFDPCVGLKAIARGVCLTSQPRTMFHFSYRTLIGTIGYKIHLVYNITATPSAKTYPSQTKSSTAPLTMEWKFDAVPPASTTYKATAHFVVDSTKATPANLALLESSLYGTDNAAPFIPDVVSLMALFAN